MMRTSVFLKQAAFFWPKTELNYLQTAHFQGVRLDPQSKRRLGQFVSVCHRSEGAGNPCELLGVVGSWYVGRT